MGETKLPEGYTFKTETCVHCKFMIDKSGHDYFEMICGKDGAPEPECYSLKYDFEKEHEQWTKMYEEYHKWAFLRRVHPWGSCPCFERKEERNETQSD